ncbi:MAG: DUF305 domain-containing protein [Rhodospirillales bacterium]|nr:DUF305 domain-containing protein [Rhodospirillales bacterium]
MPPVPPHGMQMPQPGPGPGADPAYVQGYRDALERMHRDMGIAPSASPDRDFAAGMIPHHQGAIDMARIELRYGRDPKLRKMAQEIIRAQEREIAELKRWLAAHPR